MFLLGALVKGTKVFVNSKKQELVTARWTLLLKVSKRNDIVNVLKKASVCDTCCEQCFRNVMCLINQLASHLLYHIDQQFNS